ncbi:acyl-CoA synthetase [Haloechinothrix sp. YIM 98757]|uniref:Acyl-CoA synthetase n=1 Tax=Haloechinothrix aidingensis TaxID=2752311 RepID=A0A838ACF0_9PSEU|nr:acyl-CoA synthetase [Haloechinothrix aidingensis]MBA0126920.1 acyl-CoA synthetase [Haloechinothrix aidingensis]
MSFNIADMFEHAVDLMPDRVAVICGDRQVTYAELEERSNRLAHHLAAHGVGEGSHVGLYLRNSIEAMETMLAAYKLRSVAINVNYRYTASELRYIVDNADLVALVHESGYADTVAEVLPDTPRLRHRVVVDDGVTAPTVGDGAVRYEEALAASNAERAFPARTSDDLYILYTGGTTGSPKGVMWRHEDIWRVLGGGIDFYTGEPVRDEWQQARLGAEGEGSTWFTIPPLIHGAAQWPALSALFSGGTLVLTPQFDPHEVWQLVERHAVNIAVITGDAMARPLIEALSDGGYDASSLVAIGSGAALFSPSVKRQCLEALPHVVISDSIGSSETGFGGMSVAAPDDDSDRGPRVQAGAETVVLDENDRPVRPGSGVVGRLARGGHIPLGYYKDPEKSAAMFVESEGKRYAIPGDWATVEEDGSITLLGRGNRCVNTGGEKVFPEEVEAALKSHADVFDAVVVGVPDERFGQRVAAVVELRPGRRLDFDGVSTHVRRELAGYKVPRSVWVADRIVRSPSGKPDYRWAERFTSEHAAAAHG